MCETSCLSCVKACMVVNFTFFFELISCYLYRLNMSISQNMQDLCHDQKQLSYQQFSQPFCRIIFISERPVKTLLFKQSVVSTFLRFVRFLCTSFSAFNSYFACIKTAHVHKWSWMIFFRCSRLWTFWWWRSGSLNRWKM